MALSNWDTLCFNHKGEVCEGKFTSPMGIVVEAYKNWLYIKDKQTWREGSFTNNIVMEVNSGELQYYDVKIMCEFQASYDDLSSNPSNWHSEYNRILFAIWTGYENLDYFEGIIGIGCLADMEQQDVDALQLFLKEEKKNTFNDIPDVFKNINLSKGKRYNQGDAYFHDVLGTDRQCTPVGESKDTVFSQIFNSNKDL